MIVILWEVFDFAQDYLGIYLRPIKGVLVPLLFAATLLYARPKINEDFHGFCKIGATVMIVGSIIIATMQYISR